MAADRKEGGESGYVRAGRGCIDENGKEHPAVDAPESD
jgi:hypothetical protein